MIHCLRLSLLWACTLSPTDAWQHLQQRLADPRADRAALRNDVLAFMLAHPGTPDALAAARMLQRLPSPLDLLDPRRLDAQDLPDGSVKGLAGVCRGHTRAVAALAFSPDGGVLASTGWDNKLRLWRFSGPTVTEWTVLEGSPSGIAFAPDGKSLAAGGASSSVFLWDVSAGVPKRKRRLPGHEHRPFAVAFAPSGKMLATACSEPEARLWKLEDGDLEAWAVLEEDEPTLGISSLAFSADGKKLAAASFAGNKALRLWDVGGAYMKELQVPPAAARIVAFSNDNKTLAFAGPKGAVHLWDLGQAMAAPSPLSPGPPDTGKGAGRKVLPGHPGVDFPGGVNALAFSPDGALLASSGIDRKLVVWEVASQRKRHEWQFSTEVKTLAFASDGRHLAAGLGNGPVLVLRLNAK
jgi:WD40 repeat protein